MLKLIQLGLTFTDAEGNLPTCNGELSVWQFNFKCAGLGSLEFGFMRMSLSAPPCQPSLAANFATCFAKPQSTTCFTVAVRGCLFDISAATNLC